MATALKVGGDVDAWCTRCKMNLGHTVLAMVGGLANTTWYILVAQGFFRLEKVN